MRCATLRSAASTSFSCSIFGVAVGSDSGAVTGLAPRDPTPLRANLTTALLLLMSLEAATNLSTGGLSPVERGSRDCGVIGSRGRDQLVPSAPSIMASTALPSVVDAHQPSCGGRSWQCVKKSLLNAIYAGRVSIASNQRSKAGQRPEPLTTTPL